MTPTTMMFGALLFVCGALSILTLMLLLAVYTSGKRQEQIQKKYDDLINPFRDAPK